MSLPFNRQIAPIEVVAYNSQWPVEYDALAAILWRAVGDVAVSIEHVGSTSVPGLAAKPILDIDIVIASRHDLPAIAERLTKLGYAHNGDQGCPGREAFKFPDTSVPHDPSGRHWPRHHLYVCDVDNIYYRRHVAFRDYLRSHADVAKEYGELKLSLAETYRDDRNGYTEAKTEFVFAVYRVIGGLEDVTDEGL